MSEPRVKTGIWVQALLWRCNQQGTPATVVRRGDGDAGAVLLKIARGLGEFAVLAQTRTIDDRPAWTRPNGAGPDEASADAYIARQVGRDPDLWVLEIEDREAERYLDARIF